MSLTEQVKAYMARIGKEGGKSKSDAKLKAAAKNAKKGGRPRMKKVKPESLARREYRARKKREAAKSGRS